MRKHTVKLNVLALSLLVSTSAFAVQKNPTRPYELKSVPHDVAYSEMTIGSDATNTPKALQGIWWMNGNPLADELVSFASVKWQAIEENGEVVGYTGSLPVYDAKVWSWHDSDAGKALYKAVLATKLVYVAQFNKDFSYGIVTPTFKVGPLPVKIPPSKLLTFAMRKVSDNEYSRDSLIGGIPSQYRFRRLIDANGVVLDQTIFDEFMDRVEAPNALFPVCEGDETPATLPTKCVK
jgi:hypothetical protein